MNNIGVNCMKHFKNKSRFFVGILVFTMAISFTSGGKKLVVPAKLQQEVRDGYKINDVRKMLAKESNTLEIEIFAQNGTIERKRLPQKNIENSEITKNPPKTVPSFNERKILDSGMPDNQSIVITIMGDGFTATEQTTFVNKAREAMDYMLGNPITGFTGFYPFNLFRDVFTVYAIEVISNESGVSRDSYPNNGNIVDNYFGSSFYYGSDYSTIERALVVTNNERVNELVKPYSAMTAILCNSTRWGGTGGSFAVTSLANGFHGILIHEFGHSFGGLADEYYYPSDGSFIGRERPNMTANNDPSTSRWGIWVGYNGIGHFPYSTNVERDDPNFDPESDLWFRPHNNCSMQFTGAPFCSVCAAELIKKMENITGNYFDITNIGTNSIRIENANYTIRGNYTIPPIWNNRIITSIGSSAFASQIQLTKINIPSVVTTIGVSAFYNTNNAPIYLLNRTSAPSTFHYNWNASLNPVYLSDGLCTHTNKTLTNLSGTKHGMVCNKCRTTTDIENHNNTYTWLNYTRHRAICNCGSNVLEGHFVSSSDPGFPYKTCLKCGGPASVGFVGPNGRSYSPLGLANDVVEYFGNGSYLLANGVYVISDADLDAYYAGTLALPEINVELNNAHHSECSCNYH